ncbi:putative cytochrome P450 128 Cyp128 [Mycobacterium tuberculosis H37Rv] [Mycobacterium shimoidei]|uniref:Putative cytochrome P450 128 Cyp128 [Mycobacterium tuberculosis H37Rv] n=1 Tax=Mycobacterium shimoidei TaxID=29313 RepID=A0A375Z2Y2_MYCSH|nr:cytochrome P450 [Mycobacterium shimoidei]SRX95446.1 putative cytochrome P450 128 Cyp128 [Mycobacterium tuberculosis H37Rv] [Mycobacterium shimoidei]
MSLGRRLRFRASLMKIGVDGLIGVTRDRASAYRFALTGRKTAPLTDFDPFSPEMMRDPYPGYRALLTGPDVPNVWYNRKRGIWIIAGYDDVRTALRDHDALSSAESQSRYRVHLKTMNAADPPDHTRLRKFVSRAFTPRAMKAWQQAINEVADELVDAMIARGKADVVADLAKPLPNRLIAMMLGIPREDHARFLAWSDAIVEGSFTQLTPRGIALNARSARATAAMRRNLDRLITHRRQHPGDDLISMMTASDGDDVLSDDEVFWSAAMLIGAGSETTTNLLSGLFLTLAQRPDVYARLREQPELIPGAIEEQLRLVSPVQGFYRTAVRDYTVGAHTIPAGARVLLLFAAANRDPRHYADPDTFDLDRNPTDHLAFGFGIHYCLGTPLSRLEVGRVLTQLIPRVDAIRLDGDYRYLENPTMRGLANLPVELVLAKPGVAGAGQPISLENR